MSNPVVCYLDTHLIDESGEIHSGDIVLLSDGGWRLSTTQDNDVDTINGKNKVITRSLQNWHTHAGMTLNARDFSDGFPLKKWLQEAIFPTESRLDKELVKIGTKAAASEMIRTGTTFAADLYFYPEVTAKVFHEAGLRAIIASPISEQPNPSYPEGEEQALQQTEKLLKQTPLERIEYAIGPHSIYGCSKKGLERVAQLGEEYSAKIHIHLSETRKEITESYNKYGHHPTYVLKDVGILQQGPICAHSSWLTKEEMRLLAEYNSIAVHCPSSNMKLACGGTMSYPAMKNAGVDIRLGTDGSASSGFGLDLRHEARLASLVQRHDHWDPTILPAREAWNLATKGSKDWVTWNLNDIRMRPFGENGHRIINHLIFSNTECCDMWVDGVAIRKDSITNTIDEEEVSIELENAVKRYYDGIT